MGQKAGLVYETMGITDGVSLHGTRAGGSGASPKRVHTPAPHEVWMSLVLVRERFDHRIAF